MPKYKVVSKQGWPVGGLSVHNHATGKSEGLKPDDKGIFTMDRAQARIVAQGHIVRALDSEGMVNGTPEIAIFNPSETLKAAGPATVTKESLLAKKPEDLVKSAEAFAIDLNAEARRIGKKREDLESEDIAGFIMARVSLFEAAKTSVVGGPVQELSSYKAR